MDIEFKSGEDAVNIQTSSSLLLRSNDEQRERYHPITASGVYRDRNYESKHLGVEEVDLGSKIEKGDDGWIFQLPGITNPRSNLISASLITEKRYLNLEKKV